VTRLALLAAVRDVIEVLDRHVGEEESVDRLTGVDEARDVLQNIFDFLGLDYGGSISSALDATRGLRATLSAAPGETALAAATRLRERADRVAGRQTDEPPDETDHPGWGGVQLFQIASLVSAQPDDVVGAVERLRDRAVKLAHEVDTHDRYDAEVATVLGDSDGTALQAAKNAATTIKELLRRLEQKDAS